MRYLIKEGLADTFIENEKALYYQITNDKKIEDQTLYTLSQVLKHRKKLIISSEGIFSGQKIHFQNKLLNPGQLAELLLENADPDIYVMDYTFDASSTAIKWLDGQTYIDKFGKQMHDSKKKHPLHRITV